MNSDNVEITPIIYKMLPWLGSVAFFMQTLDTSILNTALPKMAVDLNESPMNMQSTIISYALTLAVFIPVSGYLADKFGTRSIFILSLILFALGSLCCALSVDLVMLDFFRVVQGIGGAMMVPVSRLALLKTFRRDRFLDAINTSTLFGLIGPFVGPLLGGYLVEHATWHWIFLINVPIGMIGVILSIFFMPNVKAAVPKFDVIGILLVSLGFISITISFEFLNEDNTASLFLGIFLISILFFIAYFFYAKRKKDAAIFPLSLFKIRTFNIGVWGNLICRVGAQSIPFLMPLCLQLVYNYSPLESGMMLIPIALGGIVIKKLISPILNFINYKTALWLGTVTVGFIIFILAFVNLDSQQILLASLLFFMGLANSVRFTCMSALTLADLYNEKTSSGNTILSVMQQLAITFGIGLGALLVRAFTKHNILMQTTLENSFKSTFIILGVFTIVSSIIFIKLSPEDGKNLSRAKNKTNLN